MSVHEFVPTDDVDHEVVLLGEGAPVLLATHPGESTDPAHFYVKHRCTSWADPVEPDGLFVKVVAPSLNHAHVVTWDAGKVTVRASVACLDCGLHGWITAGSWMPA